MPNNQRAVFVITEKSTPEGPRSFWTRVGAAFDNRDGSVTIKLDALPLSGTLQVRDGDDHGRTGLPHMPEIGGPPEPGREARSEAVEKLLDEHAKALRAVDTALSLGKEQSAARRVEAARRAILAAVLGSDA